MDGVTDSSYRYMFAKYGSPSVSITEFTNVEGLARGAKTMMIAFDYSEIERPVVGQIYGVEVDSFYKASVMLCALGFDGVDINMGCPANKVAKRGSGAGLIRTPDLAKDIVRSCKRAALDWSNGITLEEAGLHPRIINEVAVMLEKRGKKPEDVPRVLRPVSVKTRIGYDVAIAEEWVKHLLEVEPANITMHGRTLKQMYMGSADWDEIARAGVVCRKAGVSYLGNGDVSSMEDAREKVAKYDLDGVLVGRATFGAPWFFDGKEPSVAEMLKIAVEHCRYFDEIERRWNFHHMRKHLTWYCKGFDGARELRKLMMKAENWKDAERYADYFLEGGDLRALLEQEA
jgi:tRNA-dihydrouridine synthase